MPAGPGILVPANDQVEILDNTIADNQSANVILTSSFTIGGDDDPDFDGYPERVDIHDNTFTGGGDLRQVPFSPRSSANSALSCLVALRQPLSRSRFGPGRGPLRLDDFGVGDQQRAEGNGRGIAVTLKACEHRDVRRNLNVAHLVHMRELQLPIDTRSRC